MIESFRLEILPGAANVEAAKKVKELTREQEELFDYNAIKASALASLLKTEGRRYGATYNKIYDAVSERPGKRKQLDSVKLFDTLYILNNDKLGEFLKHFISND